MSDSTSTEYDLHNAEIDLAKAAKGLLRSQFSMRSARAIQAELARFRQWAETVAERGEKL